MFSRENDEEKKIVGSVEKIVKNFFVWHALEKKGIWKGFTFDLIYLASWAVFKSYIKKLLN